MFTQFKVDKNALTRSNQTLAGNNELYFETRFDRFDGLLSRSSRQKITEDLSKTGAILFFFLLALGAFSPIK